MPSAWTFQKESQLLPIFNYYLYKLKQAGVIDELLRQFIWDRNMDMDTSKIQIVDKKGIGIEHVIFPFLGLLTGLGLAIFILGMETAIICKKYCSEDKEQSNEVDSGSEKAMEIIDDISILLVGNYQRLGGIRFLSKMRMLSTPSDDSVCEK